YRRHASEPRFQAHPLDPGPNPARPSSLAVATIAPGVSALALLRKRQETRHNCVRFLPIARLTFQLLPSGARQLVKLGSAIVVGDAPLRSYGSFLFELEQRGIERSVVQGQPVAADLLNPPGDSVSVLRSHGG